jgi:DNA invertase Pin-like site-specific DNA recombinase
MESGVEFVAVDNPHATKLTVHILAAVAEHEREMISERTRAALQAAKSAGRGWAIRSAGGRVGPTRSQKDKGVAVISTTPWVTGRARGGGNGRPAASLTR